MEEPKATRAPVLPQEDASSPFLKIPGGSRLVNFWKSKTQAFQFEIHHLQALIDEMTKKIVSLMTQLEGKDSCIAEREASNSTFNVQRVFSKLFFQRSLLIGDFQFIMK